MKACPTCHREFEREGRYCASCKKAIKQRHKWHVDGCVIRHDDCSNPTLAEPELPLLDMGEAVVRA